MDEFTMKFPEPMGAEIVRLLKPKTGEIILDVAAGTGEPGLTIAEMTGNGKVIFTIEKVLSRACLTAGNST